MGYLLTIHKWLKLTRTFIELKSILAIEPYETCAAYIKIIISAKLITSQTLTNSINPLKMGTKIRHT